MVEQKVARWVASKAGNSAVLWAELRAALRAAHSAVKTVVWKDSMLAGH
jgi:hypothetical protein